MRPSRAARATSALRLRVCAAQFQLLVLATMYSYVEKLDTLGSDPAAPGELS